MAVLSRSHSPARGPSALRARGRRRRIGVLAAVASATVAAASLVAVVSSASAEPAAAAAGSGTPSGVLANLFEWNWPSVGAECTDVLGPGGYQGVQVAPPADSLKRTALGNGSDTVLHPWWEVYQPISYNIGGRMGTDAQFRAMVTTCRRAGVKVYVDAVVNHMSGQGNVSYGGVHYTHFNYPGTYTTANFHHTPADCPTAGGIDDFNNYQQVTECELVGLADLKTESLPTRDVIAGYLNKLLTYGVSGFRVDAAKHIGESDLIAISKLLHNTVDGTRPYVALEVFPGGPGKLSQTAYTAAGAVLGFDYAYAIKNAFKSYAGGTGNIAGLSVFGEQSGLVPGAKSLVFIENHDTERGSDTLSYKDGATNTIANEFMLAYPYGTPQVYSGFAFGADTAQSPPATAGGIITNTDCANGWVCVDRDPGVLAMVKFHNYTAGAAVTNWWDDGRNTIAFSRGGRGFFATNNSTTATTASIQTSLTAGTYCDVVHGGAAAGACVGAKIVVDSHGVARVTVPAKDSIAFTAADRIK